MSSLALVSGAVPVFSKLGAAVQFLLMDTLLVGVSYSK